MKYLKIKEVADILGVTTMTIYRWINEGRIKTIKIVGTVRIEEEELKRFITDRGE